MEAIEVYEYAVFSCMETGSSTLKTNKHYREIRSQKDKLSPEEYYQWVKDNVIITYHDKQWRIHKTNVFRLVSLDFNVIDYVHQTEIEVW